MLKLAEAHGAFCRDRRRAAKIVEKIEVNPSFTPEQIQIARTRLKEWSKA